MEPKRLKDFTKAELERELRNRDKRNEIVRLLEGVEIFSVETEQDSGVKTITIEILGG